MNYLISMFIDDELDLDDKVQFVEQIHINKDLKDESVDLLNQEIKLRDDVVESAPEVDIKAHGRRFSKVIRPAAFFTSGLAAAAMIIFVLISPQPEAATRPYRFVIHQPGATMVELTGSFLNWGKAPMVPAKEGYWSITLDLPAGEHRFSYVVDNSKMMADPTVASSERDDFGGENSIILLEEI